MTLETLYKRTKTGAIQYWKIEAGYSDPNANIPHDAFIRKESGQLGTLSPVIHIEDIIEGKNIGRANETTPFQQAESQAKSDWTKKRDEGYKSSEDLGIPTKNIDPVGYNFNKLLDEALPQFNTDSSGNVKPMLATDWKKIKKIEYPVHVQPKFDGVRCLMIADETDIIMLSRSGKQYTALNHIIGDIVAYMENNGYPPFILDGEIYSDELNFQEIVSAVKAYKENSLKLKFRAYDVVNDMIWADRLILLDAIVTSIDSEFIELTPTTEVSSEEEVRKNHDLFVAEGFEGAMIRTLNGKYGQGQRSRDLLKVKEFDETEFIFHGFVFGQRDEDLIAMCTNMHGAQFKAKMKGSAIQKKAMYLEYQGGTIGKITVIHFKWTEDGLPRFPIGKAIRDYE